MNLAHTSKFATNRQTDRQTKRSQIKVSRLLAFSSGLRLDYNLVPAGGFLALLINRYRFQWFSFRTIQHLNIFELNLKAFTEDSQKKINPGLAVYLMQYAVCSMQTSLYVIAFGLGFDYSGCEVYILRTKLAAMCLFSKCTRHSH